MFDACFFNPQISQIARILWWVLLGGKLFRLVCQ